MSRDFVAPIRTIALVIFISTILSSGAAVYGNEPQNGTDVNITIDSKLLEFPNQPPVIIDGVTYVPIKEIEDALGLSVVWNGGLNTVDLVKGQLRISFAVGMPYARLNDMIIAMPESKIVNQKAMVPLKFITNQLGYSIKWNAKYRAVMVSSTGTYLTDEQVAGMLPEIPAVTEPVESAATYSEDDIYWLSRIVHAEAQGESLEAKIAVANVIINRTNDPSYPDTIKGVVFDTRFGIQFTPISNGAVYNKPSAESVEAAKLALGGRNNAKDVLFFLNPQRASNSWISQNRTFAFKLENHDFYY